MSKRNKIVAVICIVVAALSFMGGMVYKYEDYTPVVKHDVSKNKFTIDFVMPLDAEIAHMWLDWATDLHQSRIDAEAFTELRPLEFHQESILMYHKIKVLFREFDEKWGVNE